MAYIKDGKGFILNETTAFGMRKTFELHQIFEIQKNKNIISEDVPPSAVCESEILLSTYSIKEKYGFWLNTQHGTYELYEFNNNEAKKFIVGILAASREIGIHWRTTVFSIVDQNKNDIKLNGYEKPRLEYVVVSSSRDGKHDEYVEEGYEAMIDNY